MQQMNYAIQCTDTVTGKKGTFGFDTAEYLAADKPLQFKAMTPVFNGMQGLCAWARVNDVDLFIVPVSWETERTNKEQP